MSAELQLGRHLYALDRMEEHVTNVIKQLPLRAPDGTYLVNDEALRTTTLSAQAGAKAFWRLACAGRAEIVRRITERIADPIQQRAALAREAAEQHVSVSILRRDAAIGNAYAPLFAEPDAAPDLERGFYEVAARAPDPQEALALAAQRKDADPFYSTHDFRADIAVRRVADPATGYSAQQAGRVGLAFIEPYWGEGVLEATQKVLELPLRRWLLPDAFLVLRCPVRALDLALRCLAAHDLWYQGTVLHPVELHRDGPLWQKHEMLVLGARGALRCPEMPGLWEAEPIPALDCYFAFITPKLAVYPRRVIAVRERWITPQDLPDGVR